MASAEMKSGRVRRWRTLNVFVCLHCRRHHTALAFDIRPDGVAVATCPMTGGRLYLEGDRVTTSR